MQLERWSSRLFLNSIVLFPRKRKTNSREDRKNFLASLSGGGGAPSHIKDLPFLIPCEG